MLERARTEAHLLPGEWRAHHVGARTTTTGCRYRDHGYHDGKQQGDRDRAQVFSPSPLPADTPK
jgi:hypothetical protein